MIISAKATQQVDSLWHELECFCPENHSLTPLKMEASKFGNFRFVWLCLKCQARYFETRNNQELTNECCELDMLAYDEGAKPAPLATYLIVKGD